MSTIALVALVVRDYDEAIRFYCGALGFDLVEDTALDDDKRWVVVAPPGGGTAGTSLLLAHAATDAQRARIGDQTGGRVFLFLRTDDFAADHERMLAAGVRFVEPPRHEAYGTVAVFEDLYGTRWDLVERRPSPGAHALRPAKVLWRQRRVGAGTTLRGNGSAPPCRQASSRALGRTAGEARLLSQS